MSDEAMKTAPGWQRYAITPVPKPRQTRRDQWLSPPRPCVAQYRRFKDQVRAAGIDLVPGYWIVFLLPMPKSWTKKKRDEMRLRPHMQTPDKDNLEKAILDAVHAQDSHIWDGRVSKVWADEGAIMIGTVDSDSWEVGKC